MNNTIKKRLYNTVYHIEVTKLLDEDYDERNPYTYIELIRSSTYIPKLNPNEFKEAIEIAKRAMVNVKMEILLGIENRAEPSFMSYAREIRTYRKIHLNHR